MELLTVRLIIDKATIADADFFFQLLNSPTWLEHIGDRGIQTKEDAEAYIEKSLLASYRHNGFGLWKVSLKESIQPIGICGFLKRDYLDAPDIGFAMLPQYEGFGYMLEACRTVMEYGVLELNFTEVMAVTTTNNVRSQKLLSKLGFSEIGTVQPLDREAPFLLFSNL
ncbi:GNAT family N-acetyltransferase [Maribacter sp. 4G9]|uniref:GNAT family N-acetyltransferase n=1 Tax=Maribacter sp. 4G9 TaxID=1889777 RepID=UPI000C159566|nr:GNAT family N-acetyltransferase [Maribacter sp. 4G9]PIB38517.1 hypothetical protein BFP75_16600 [Maribacter sp. 4G9]